MKPDSISSANLPEDTFSTVSSLPGSEGQDFDGVLKSTLGEYEVPRPDKPLMSTARPISSPNLTASEGPRQASTASPAPNPGSPAGLPPAGSRQSTLPASIESKHEQIPIYSSEALSSGSVKAEKPAHSVTKAAAAYKQAMKPAQAPETLSDFQKYKDDQLLRNPGGRNYYLDRKLVTENPQEQASFLGRVGKDISSVLGNFKNFLGNIFLGSKFLYRGENNELKEGRQKGLLATVGNFFKDLGSALSFGAFHPDEKDAPAGFWNRLVYSSTKLKDALLGGLVEGIPASFNHMGKNLVLAGWHLVQVVPDATIGNFDAGRKLTTSLFDNGHLLVEYITDVVPSGDAWLRVHASNIKELQPPLLYNLKMPEHFTGDTRWEYVRNTPFRKSIESVGALLADVAAVGLIGQSGFSSNRHQRVID